MTNKTAPASPSQNSPERWGLLGIFSGVLFGLLLSKLRTPLPQENGKSIHPKDSATSFSPTVVQETHAKPERNHSSGRKNETPFRKQIYEWSVAIGTLGLLLVNIFLMSYTKKAAVAAKSAAETASNQFTLEKRHVEDTDEAICHVTQDIMLRDTLEKIIISNGGKVSAHTVYASIEISRNSLPDNKKLISLERFNVSRDELRVGQPITKEITLKNINWQELYSLREALVIMGTIQYENGFEDWRKPDFCQALIVEPASQNSMVNGQPTAIGTTVDCDAIPGTYKRYKEWQKQENQNKH